MSPTYLLEVDDMFINKFNFNNINPLDHYCPDGKLHKIQNYIYQEYVNNKPKKEMIELSKKQIIQWLNDNNTKELEKYNNMKIVNAKCMNCGKYILSNLDSEVNKNSNIINSSNRNSNNRNSSNRNLNQNNDNKNDKIQNIKNNNSKSNELQDIKNIFKEINNVSAFYQYFDVRCPEGNLHDLEKSNCKKCGYNTEFNKNNDKQYYKKYKNIFIKIQKEKNNIINNNLKSIHKIFSSTYEKHKSDIKYENKTINIVNLSKLTDRKYNILINLGLSENNKYSDIINNKINPSTDETDEIALFRSKRLKSYLINIIQIYNTIKNFNSISKLNPEIKKLIDDEKNLDTKKLNTNLPDINETQLTNIQEYENNLDPKNYSNYLLEMIAEILLFILEKTSEQYKNFSLKIINFILDKIIYQEMVLSIYDFKLFKTDVSVKDESENESDYFSGDDIETGIIRSQKTTDVDTDREELETYDTQTITNNAFDMEDDNGHDEYD